MLTDDLFLARESCFPQASLVSSVGSLHLHRGSVMASESSIAGCQHQLPTVQAYRVLALTSRCIHFCLSSALDRPTNQFFSVCPSVCLSVCVSVNRWFSNDYVHNSLPIFTKFCTRLRNAVVSSRIVCETNQKQLADFRGVQIPISAIFRLPAGDHIFQQISRPTKSHIQIQEAQLSLRDRATRACQLKSGKVLHKCRRLVFEKL